MDRLSWFSVAGGALPGSGLMVLIMLKILERFDLSALGHNSPEYLRILTEVIKYATQDRLAYFGDPRFVSVPVEELLTDERSAARAERIRQGEKAQLVRAGRERESASTTHICSVDEQGNAVTLTHTLGPVSGVVTEGLGFLHNACMAIFDPRPDRPSSIAPGRSYQSSISPMMVFKGDDPYLVVGAPGATHIPLAVLQAIVNVLDFGLDMAGAVSAPRISVTSEIIDVSNRILTSSPVRWSRLATRFDAAPSAMRLPECMESKSRMASLSAGQIPVVTVWRWRSEAVHCAVYTLRAAQPLVLAPKGRSLILPKHNQNKPGESHARRQSRRGHRIRPRHRTGNCASHGEPGSQGCGQ